MQLCTKLVLCRGTCPWADAVCMGQSWLTGAALALSAVFLLLHCPHLLSRLSLLRSREPPRLHACHTAASLSLCHTTTNHCCAWLKSHCCGSCCLLCCCSLLCSTLHLDRTACMTALTVCMCHNKQTTPTCLCYPCAPCCQTCSSAQSSSSGGTKFSLLHAQAPLCANQAREVCLHHTAALARAP